MTCKSDGSGYTSVSCQYGCSSNSCNGAPLPPPPPGSNQVCTPHAIKCVGSELGTCKTDGSDYTYQSCQYGCSNNSCNAAPAGSQPPPPPPPSSQGNNTPLPALPLNVVANNLGPKCLSLSADPGLSGQAPYIVLFKAVATPDTIAGVQSMIISFGENFPVRTGQSGNTAVTHSYNLPGTYYATAFFYDKNGNTSVPPASCKLTIIVTAPPGYVAATPSALTSVTSANLPPKPVLPEPGLYDRLSLFLSSESRILALSKILIYTGMATVVAVFILMLWLSRFASKPPPKKGTDKPPRPSGPVNPDSGSSAPTAPEVKPDNSQTTGPQPTPPEPIVPSAQGV